MYDVAESLHSGFTGVQVRMRDAQAALAHANAGETHTLDGAMAETARAALFEEALLGAVRARFEEIKSVAK